jgi:tetratricopeptide (TPR) repeat protein
MRAAPQFVVLVILLLVVAAISLSPRRAEEVAALADEGRHEEAIALIERLLTEQPGDPSLLAALGRSHAALGRYRQATDALDAYLTLRPADLAARERQAALLLQSGLIDRYFDAMERVVAARPSAAQVSRLVELYRLHGRFDDELRALRVHADRGMLSLAQVERLGALLAERERWLEARRWLRWADAKRAPGFSEGRLLLLEVLLLSNEPEQAFRHAQVWMRRWRSAFLSVKLILMMARSGLAAQAAELAITSIELMPEAALDIAGVVARNGQQAIARQMLARWADLTTNPTAEQLRGFVYVSALVGDAHAAIVRLLRLARTGGDRAAQAQLAEELANAFGKQALASIWPMLPRDVFLARPLFAAELSIFEGDRELARRFLAQADPARLTAEGRTQWLALLRVVETPPGVFDRLAALWGEGRLPPELLPAFADAALKAGQPGMHDLIWSSLRLPPGAVGGVPR